jgi:hypothetical protein
LLVDQFREIARPHLTEIGNTQDKANGIQNVGLSRAVQTGNRVKVGIKAGERKEG